VFLSGWRAHTFEQKQKASWVMSRRRKNEPSLADVLLRAPWWVSVVLAIGGYIALHGLLPSMLARSPYLLGIAMMMRGLAWVPALLFCGIALLSYLRQRRQGGGEHLRGVRTERSTPTARSHQARPRPQASASPVDAAMDALRRGTGGSAQPVKQPLEPEINSWSLDALKLLEWKRFELLCVGYYDAMGFTVKTVPHGPDGGIDATLYKMGSDTPVAVVQCKAWNKPVKVKEVRALAGVMHEHKIRRGVFWSLSGYVGRPVQESAERAGIQLLDGAAIVERIRALDQYKQATLLAQAFKGDYRTPTCAACGVKLVAREGKSGPFWGCVNYPPCRFTLPRAA